MASRPRYCAALAKPAAALQGNCGGQDRVTWWSVQRVLKAKFIIRGLAGNRAALQVPCGGAKSSVALRMSQGNSPKPRATLRAA